MYIQDYHVFISRRCFSRYKGLLVRDMCLLPCLIVAGVGLAASPEGLRVTEIVPQGAAYKSGRICVDDVFVSIDGHHV